jgi:hypothetical protein
LAQKTQSYDTKMLLKVVFEKTPFVKFKINNNFIQKIDENTFKTTKNFIEKSIPAYVF